MTIKTQLSEKEFINASLATIWSRPYSKIFLIVFAFIMGVNIFNSASLKFSLIPTVVPLVIFFSALFFVFRYSFKKAYQKNLRAGENIEYDFTESSLRITGESFTSEMTWDKIYKVTKSKNWLLIWHSSQTANAIPLRLFSFEYLSQLKTIIEQNKVKNNL